MDLAKNKFSADMKSGFNEKEQELIYKLNSVRRDVDYLISKRITEFDIVNESSNEDWFHELCFCLLTANTSAKMGLKIQGKVKAKEFLKLPEEKLKEKLNKLRCRFYNKRAEYIVLARKFADIKDQLSHFPTSLGKREFLVSNIKGMGLKEASHFLRNTGHYDVAILDKHVKNLLVEHEIVPSEKVEKMNEHNYFYIESKLDEIARSMDISQGELDFLLWYMKTGEVLK